MKLGQKFTKELAESSGGQGGFIRGFKDGDTTVRFLNEMDADDGGWTFYREHFDPVNTVSYPCLGEKTLCPGCQSDNERERRSSGRYLVNALTEDGYVNLYRIPQSLINTFIKYSERDGSITKRDYTISRTGSGLKTEYSVMADDKAQVDITAYADQMQDHEEALKSAFIEAWGIGPAEVAEQMQRGVYPKKVGGRDMAAAPEDAKPKTPSLIEDDPTKTSEKPPFNEGQQETEDSSGDDVIEYSRAELLKLSKLQLRKVYRQASLEWPEDAASYDQEDLVDHLIEELI